jgi:hypothetical protein
VKITARITGTADLARLDVTRLVQRLTADLERQPHIGVPLQSPSPRVSEARRSTDGETYLGTARFRAVTEPT